MIRQLTQKQLKSLTTSDRPNVIFCDVNGCCPCRSVESVVEKLSEEFEELDFYKYVVEDILYLEEDILVSKYQVRPFPTVLFLKGEQEIYRIVGEQPTDQFRKACEMLKE